MIYIHISESTKFTTMYNGNRVNNIYAQEKDINNKIWHRHVLEKGNTNMVCASCTKIEYFLVSGEADMIGVIRLVGAT